MAFIEARELRYDYEQRDDDGKLTGCIPALKGLDFSVERGEFVAVIGHNGSGKSTLARLINALAVPTGGSLIVNDIDVSDEKLVWELRKSVGMVFQNPDNQIIAGIVEEDVAFGPENLGVPSEEIISRVKRALEIVGMTKYARRSPGRLSGGQKQRVAIAGALAMMPQCIILDEATAMLDPIGRREVMEVVSRLNSDEQMTVLLITHYMEEAAMAGRVIVMDDGNIVLDGTPAEVFAHDEELAACGLELPQAAMLAKKIRDAGLPVSRDVVSTRQLVDEIVRIKNGNRA